MKKLAFIFLFLTTVLGFGQSLKLVPIRKDSIAISADQFLGVDGFKNYYYIKSNVLFKKNAGSILQFQALSLGAITKVDILNPLKIIVFYETFNTAVILDYQLNEVQRIDFSKFDNSIVVSAIGIAGQNKLWIFNSLKQQLGLFDLVTFQYQEIGNTIGEAFSYYQSDYNYFQWITKNNQWKTCNLYGSISTIAKEVSVVDCQIIADNKILFLKDNSLLIRDYANDKQYQIAVVEKSLRNFFYKDQILTIFTNEIITNYKLTIP